MGDILKTAGWSEGAATVKQLDQVVQCQFFSQLKYVLTDLRIAMTTAPKVFGCIELLLNELNNILLCQKELESDTLRAFSRILAGKGLYGGAVLCLQFSVEKIIEEDFFQKNPYEDINGYGDDKFKKKVLDPFYDSLNGMVGMDDKTESLIHFLRKSRNAVAHSGNLRDGKVVLPDNLMRWYDGYATAVSKLDEIRRKF